jgi:membrane fusion protein (multidrug efflux system)
MPTFNRMKSNASSPGLIPLLTGLLCLAGCHPGEPEEEKTAPTEVAVQVAQVTRATLRATVEAYGTVEPEPAGGGKPGGAARLSAPAAGVVMEVPVKEGERIEAGAVVVRLDDRVALAVVERARTAVAFGEQLVARQERLQRIEGTSQKAIQEAAQQLATAKAELAAAEAQLALVQLRSPLAGTVARIHVQPGQAVDLNTVVAEIVDTSRLVVTANMPAAEAAPLKAGQPAEITADAVRAAGTVQIISPQADPKTGTVLVRVSVPGDAGLRPGQFVRVRIVIEERPGRLAVPRESVYTDPDGASTLSLVEGGIARQRAVKVGLRDGPLVEVEGEGITEGATVVTLGSYALPKETRVRVLDSRPTEAGK